MSQSGKYSFLNTPLESLTGNSGGPVAPTSGNINLLGTDPIDVAGNPGTSTLTITVADATTTQKGVSELATDAEAIAGLDTSRTITPSSLAAKLGDQTQYAVPYGNTSAGAILWTAAPTDGQLVIGATGAAPAFADLTSTGGTVTITPGANTLNIEVAGAVGTTFTTNSGVATPSGGNLNVFGGANIATSGVGDTLTIAFDGFLPVASGGTGNVSLTNHGVLLGSGVSPISVTSPATDGQVLVGSTGSDPAFTTITSSDSSITITGGASTLDLTTGAAVADSFPTDGATATPAAGALTIAGGSNITSSGSGSTVTIDLDNTVTISGDFSTTGGAVNIGTATPGNPYDLSIEQTIAGLIGSSMQNLSTNAAAGVNMQMIVEPGGGDAFCLFNVSGATTWSAGIDNSDSDTLKITTGSSPSGGTEVINATTAGVVTIPNTLTVTTAANLSYLTQYTLPIVGASGAIQDLADARGAVGEVLTSNGNSAEPTWQANSSFTWNVETGATKTADVNNGYFANFNGTLAFTLPSTAAVGDTIEICQMFAGQGFTVAVNSGETIYIGNTNTTITTGTLASTDDGDWIQLVCRVANTDWQCNVKSGNITVT